MGENRPGVHFPAGPGASRFWEFLPAFVGCGRIWQGAVGHRDLNCAGRGLHESVSSIGIFDNVGSI